METVVGRLCAWVAMDFPNGERISNVMNKVTAATGLGTLDFPGMVVKTEMSSSLLPGGKSETTLISAAEQSVDPKEIEIPSEYQEIDMK